MSLSVKGGGVVLVSPGIPKGRLQVNLGRNAMVELVRNSLIKEAFAPPSFKNQPMLGGCFVVTILGFSFTLHPTNICFGVSNPVAEIHLRFSSNSYETSFSHSPSSRPVFLVVSNNEDLSPENDRFV